MKSRHKSIKGDSRIYGMSGFCATDDLEILFGTVHFLGLKRISSPPAPARMS